jgi:small ligand-binding sensory domain FIST
MTASESKVRVAAALSTHEDTVAAAQDACRQIERQDIPSPQLAFVFASSHHAATFEALAETIAEQLKIDCVLGCTGESIVGTGREIENEPALALWVGRLGNATLLPMRLDFVPTPDGGSFVGWPDGLEDSAPGETSLLLLADPFSFPADVLLARLNDDRPGLRVFGGMASGAWGPKQNRLLLGRQVFDSGAVGVAVRGDVRVRSVVSQGCRPIGRPLVVTKAQQNVLLELGGKPALGQLQEIFRALTAEEQQMARQGLHVGLVIDEYREGFGRGDFLVRNVQGIDPDQGAIAIGDYARVGQTVQFHVRDAATADEDLHALVSAVQADTPGRPQGGLLFTCNGRGTRLFDTPHHDAKTLDHYWDKLPVAGFFAQGEMGPVGGKNFLHGFTASIVLFS